MASFRLLGFFLIIVCRTRLGLAAGTVDELPDTMQPVGASNQDATTTNFTTRNSSEASNSSTSVTTTSTELSTSRNSSVVVNNSSENVTSSNVSSTASGESTFEIFSTAETPQEVDNRTYNGNKDDVIEAPDEIRFWWSDSTLLSILIPVSVGLGCGVFVVTFLCCMRWFCCRRRCLWCCGGRRGRSRVDTSPTKKTLRVKEDFRQLRQVDRMKLLAETSDDEF